MNIYHTESSLLLLFLKQKQTGITYLSNIKEVYDHAPQWVPGKKPTLKVMLYKGEVNEDIPLPNWEGDLYILGKSSKGQLLNLDLYQLIPDLKRYRRLFTPQCWRYLEKRFKTYPLICEWEVSILLGWAGKGASLPIDTQQVIEVLQINPPEELMMTQYKKVWGTREGAEFLYNLKDAELWLLIHKCLEFHLQGSPWLLTCLQHTRNRCEQGLPIREEAIILNSLISKYTSSSKRFK